MRSSNAGPVVVILFAAVAVCGCGPARLTGGAEEPSAGEPIESAADGGTEPEQAACPTADDFVVEPKSGRSAAVEDQIWRALRLGFLDENADVRRAAETALCHDELKPAAAFPEWRERIERSGRQDVCALVYALFRMGWRGEDPIPELTRQLDSDDEETVRFAAEALGVIGPAAASAAPALVRAAKKGEDWTRAAAVRALGQIGTAHPAVLPALTRMLKVKDRRGGRRFSAQQSAVYALGAVGREAGHLAPRIAKIFVKENLANKYGLETTADVYAEVLISLDPSGDSWIDVFVRALKRGAHRDNGEIMPFLTDAGKSAARAAPEIAKIFRDDDDDTHHAPGILKSLGPAAAGAVPTLIEVVEDEERDVWDHIEAIRILGAIGPEAATALPALESSLDSEYESVRFEASVASARIKGEPVPRKSARELLEPLGNRSRLDYEDLAALAALGPEALDAAPRLLELLGSDDPYTRRITADSILYMVERQPDPPGALPQLVAQVICEIDNIHWDAATVLARLGPPVARLAPFLAVALEAADDGERQAAAWALSNLGPSAAPVRPALMEVLSCDTAGKELWKTQRYAMESIAAIGARPDDLDQLLALLECVPSEEKDARIAAIRAVASVGAAGRERVLPALERLVREADDGVGRAAGAGVGGLGAETLPLLLEILDIDSHEARLNALAGLQAMDADAASSLDRLLRLAGDLADGYRGEEQARAIADAVCAMGGGIVDALHQELKQGGVPERRRAVVVMGYMFARTAEIAPLLVEALDDESPEVRQAVIEALGRLL